MLLSYAQQWIRNWVLLICYCLFIFTTVTISDPDSEQEFTLKLLVALFLVRSGNFDEACKQIFANYDVSLCP